MQNLIDLHTHSVLSNHAYSTITENIEQAIKSGLKYMGTSEHQSDDVGVGATTHCFLAIRRVPRHVENLTVFYGCEFNILEGGVIDLNGIREKELDYGIASIHIYKYQGPKDVETVTNMYLNALDNDLILILGHINQRLFPCDYRRVLEKAKACHKLVEFNNSKVTDPIGHPREYEGAKEILRICKEIKQPIIIDSDAHVKYEVGNIDASLKIIEECDFPKELILNFNENLINEYIKQKD